MKIYEWFWTAAIVVVVAFMLFSPEYKRPDYGSEMLYKGTDGRINFYCDSYGNCEHRRD